MDSSRKTIAVGMSGGIDSTMAAYILKQEGYSVIGLTMKIWDGMIACESSRSGCYGPNESLDIAEAKRTAARLGIEHYVLDLCREYKDIVLDYFSKEYTSGRTPNPCVVCNSKIKFGSLVTRALLSGIHFNIFATGHYARTVHDPVTGRYILMRGIDESKDQSYFLYRLSQDQLGKISFPLGGYRKDEIKTMAACAGFGEYLVKSESQDFLEWDDYSALLKTPGRPGNIVDSTGNVLGRHRGIAYYTVGQRKTLKLGGMKEPYYVISIDAEHNEIIAGPKKYLKTEHLAALDINWIIPFEERPRGRVKAKIRSMGRFAECTVFPQPDKTAHVYFSEPQEAVAPGQSIVFYVEDIVLGGGTIGKPGFFIPRQRKERRRGRSNRGNIH